MKSEGSGDKLKVWCIPCPWQIHETKADQGSAPRPRSSQTISRPLCAYRSTLHHVCISCHDVCQSWPSESLLSYDSARISELLSLSHFSSLLLIHIYCIFLCPQYVALSVTRTLMKLDFTTNFSLASKT